MRDDCCNQHPHVPGCPWAPDNTICTCVDCGDDIYECEVELGLSDGFRCRECLEDYEKTA